MLREDVLGQGGRQGARRSACRGRHGTRHAPDDRGHRRLREHRFHRRPCPASVSRWQAHCRAAGDVKFGRWVDVVSMQRPLAKVTPTSPDSAAPPPQSADNMPSAATRGRLGEGAHPRCGSWPLTVLLPHAAAVVRLHIPVVVIGGRGFPGAHRPDSEHRACLLAKIPLVSGSRPDAAARPAAPFSGAAVVGWSAIQPALALSAVLLALSDPAGAPAAAVGAAALVAFLSAQPGHRGGCLAHRELRSPPSGSRHGRLRLGSTAPLC